MKSNLSGKLTKVLHLFVAALLTALILPLSPTPLAYAATITITVDTTIDPTLPLDPTDYQACTDANDDCSLRGAITKANKDTGNDYTITLPAGIYILSVDWTTEDEYNWAGDLDIASNITINGAGQDTIIDGGGIDRVLHIMGGATVVINDVTIRNGKAPDGQDGEVGGLTFDPAEPGSDGGGIYNAGVLTLNNVTVKESAAGAGGYGGAVCLFACAGLDGGGGGRGGGIYNAGQLTLNNSTVQENAAGDGGDGFGGEVQGSGGPGGLRWLRGQWGRCVQ